jgi:ubiquinone/menaquinone biosynthesis C-methylase UbiE
MDDLDCSSAFESAAPYYDAFRARYAPAAFDSIISAFGLGDDCRVLDLGCGHGRVTIPLSRAVAEVVAVDPSAQMLAEARMLASRAGCENIRWIQARAEDVLLKLGRFRVVTMGQSFHWMDRDDVLRRLPNILEDGGGLALLDEGKRRPQESWEDTAAQVVAKYLGRRSRDPRKHPEMAHEPSLGRSANFSGFTVREFPTEITRDIASVRGCVYSNISAAKPLFGANASAFEANLAQALLRLNPTGVFKERLETAVFIAPRIAG